MFGHQKMFDRVWSPNISHGFKKDNFSFLFPNQQYYFSVLNSATSH